MYTNFYELQFNEYRLMQMNKSKNNEKNNNNKLVIKEKENKEFLCKNEIKEKKENKDEIKEDKKQNRNEIKEEKKEDKNEIKEEIEENKNEIREVKETEENEFDEEEEEFLFIETSKKSLQFSFYFDSKDGKSNLFGIFNIGEINPENPEYIDEKKLEKYEIFYDYYNILIKAKEPEDNYFEKIKKFGGDKNITALVNNYSYFKNIKYKYYIIYINICLFFYMYLMENKYLILEMFKKNFNKLNSSNLPIYQKIRIMRFTCKECFNCETDKKTFKLYLLNSLPDDSVYKLAFDYNKKIINDLREQSELYFPFLQMDNYILLNYYVNSNSYTLSMEPLIFTKHHLLSLYEPFFFLSFEIKTVDNKIRFASQCTKNDITMINEYGLFGEEVGSAIYEKNKNLVIPISMELLHEKNGHSKRMCKNKRNKSPMYFFEKNNLIQLEESKQRKIGEEGESGRIVEYFIKYDNNNFVDELKKNFIYGDIINNTKYFTNNNFKELYEKMKSILTISKDTKINNKSNQSFCLISDEMKENENEEQERINIFEKFDETKLQYYEKRYLVRGKYFVYPDSIPFIYPSIDGSYNIPQGLQHYLDKYAKQIEEGRKLHYGQ